MTEVGLTGGIGSGKSTVGAELARRGAVVIDADAIVRELQAPGRPVFEQMVEAFGPTIVTADGTLDRAAVAEIVFNDADALATLNGIVHPAVGAEMERRRTEALESGAVVVLDIPLLVDAEGRLNPAYTRLDGVIVVDVDVDTAVERLVTHRGFSEADARARMAAQATREQRRAVADIVLDNSGDLDHLATEVDRCWAWLESLDPTPDPA